MAVSSSSMAFAGLFVALSCVLILAQDPLPFLSEIPATQFTCAGRNYGYYADLEANCQAFHVCQNGYKWSFLCPNQTLFNQHYLVCDYPTNVDCPKSEDWFKNNDYFGRLDVRFLE